MFQEIWSAIITTTILTSVLFAARCHGEYFTIAGCPVIWNEPFNSQYVRFYLNTRDKNGSVEEYVEFRDISRNNMSSSRYNPNLKNVVLVHGFSSSRHIGSLQSIKDEYLKSYDKNIWFLDWSALTPDWCYVTSTFNLEYVGRFLALFVNSIGLPKSNLHVIGFSLGGHAAALAANHLKPYVIPRITGLDPAMPLFLGYKSERRLSPDDGLFVDVIHTNAFLEGNFLTMGHVDFFMNGGIKQPGCGNIFNFVSCSHDRVGWYYAESINSADGFWGWPCNHYLEALSDRCQRDGPLSIMGAHINTTSEGIKYVETNDKSPFAKGKIHSFKGSIERYNKLQ